MEERIIDDPRKIKVKRNAAGGVEDATDALAADGGQEDGEELVLDVPEEELMEGLDEDLIGLAPSQLEAELERRRKEAEEAEKERDRILAAAEDLFAKGRYEKAEPLFAQALAIDPTCTRAQNALWLCRSGNFTSTEGLLNETCAREFAEADDDTRAFVLGALGERMKTEKAALEGEAVPLRARVRAGQEKRREAFKNNRDYYRVRFFAVIGAMLFLLIAAGISSAFIARTPGYLPVVFVIAFAACAVVLLPLALYLARKLFVAQKYCLDNEKLSSTEEGEKLEEIEERIRWYNAYLGV